MKAVRIHEFGGPEVLKIEEVAEPKVGQGEVLIEMEAAGVNYADVMTRVGMYPIRGLPVTPGFASSRWLGSSAPTRPSTTRLRISPRSSRRRLAAAGRIRPIIRRQTRGKVLLVP